MVTVTFDKSGDARCIMSSGHCGAAPSGQDIFCAGISTLICAIPPALKCRCTQYAAPGECIIRVDKPSESDIIILDAFERAIRAYASQFSRFVRVEDAPIFEKHIER